MLLVRRTPSARRAQPWALELLQLLVALLAVTLPALGLAQQHEEVQHDTNTPAAASGGHISGASSSNDAAEPLRLKVSYLQNLGPARLWWGGGREVQAQARPRA